MQKLKNKVAVITGGSSGIGFATAKKFVEEGAYVFITGRRQGELDKAKKEIGSNVKTVQGDIANLADLDNLYKIVKQEKGTIDIIVANAGFVEMVTSPNVTEEHFDKTFNINARGTFFSVQKGLPILNNDGAIVVVSSCVTLKGFPQYVTYSATKAAIRSFVRTWAAELKDKNIRVNALSPRRRGLDIFCRLARQRAPDLCHRFLNQQVCSTDLQHLLQLLPNWCRQQENKYKKDLYI